MIIVKWTIHLPMETIFIIFTAFSFNISKTKWDSI